MGASDATIAGHFQHHAWRLARKAAGIGFLLAAISFAALLFALRHMIDPTALPLIRWLALGLLLILVPLAAIGTAVLSARRTVFKFLQPIS
jgi:cell division protein FtsX